MIKITSDLNRAFRINRTVAAAVTTAPPGAWTVIADGGDTLLSSGVATSFSVNQVFTGGDSLELTGDVAALNQAPLLEGRYTAITDQFVTLNNATPEVGDSLFIANQQDLLDLSTNTGKVLVAKSINDRGWKVGEVIKVHSTFKFKGQTFTDVIEYVRTATQLVDPFNVYSLNLDGVNDAWYTPLVASSPIRDIVGCSGLDDVYTQNSGLTLSAWFKTTDTLADISTIFGLSTATNVTNCDYIYLGVAATGLSSDAGNYVPFAWARTSAVNPSGKTVSYTITGLTTTEDPLQRFNDTTGVFDGEWHHVAASYTGSGLYLYVDNYYDTDDYVELLEGVFDEGGSFSNVLIGRSHGNTSSGLTEYFEGNINELSVWNRALTTSEISDIYNSGSPGPLQDLTFATGLVGWWRCGDGAEGGKGISGMTPAANGTLTDMLYEAGTWPTASGTNLSISGLYTGMFEKG